MLNSSSKPIEHAMKLPLKWNLKRPGLLIPVFFLSMSPVSGQLSWRDSFVSAAGGCYVSRTGITSSRNNQAGLGWINQHSITTQHAQPYFLGELGIASLSMQVPVKQGGFGVTFSTFGLRGLRETSSWISYGMKLFPDIAAGIGIHLWNTSIRDDLVHHPGGKLCAGHPM